MSIRTRVTSSLTSPARQQGVAAQPQVSATTMATPPSRSGLVQRHALVPAWFSTRRRLLTLGALALLALVTSGCGYTQQALYPDDVHTVAVPIFQNRSFYQGLEFDVTEALTKELELRTPYKVVSQDRADTVIEGTILRVSQSRLSRDPDTGLIQEYELTVVVNVEWKNLRTGKTLCRRDGLSAVGRAAPAASGGEPLEHAQHGAAEKLANAILAAMRGQW